MKRASSGAGFTPITIMYHLFGRKAGENCRDCRHFRKGDKQTCWMQEKYTSRHQVQWPEMDACGAYSEAPIDENATVA